MAKNSYLVLARKYRPKTFDEVVGQSAAVQTLRNAVESNHVGQGYLFSGPRGVGKTTMARLLAKSLNCLSSDEPTAIPCNKCDACKAISNGDDIDVLEIDGASNRKVEESRDLRETVQYAPVRCRYKIYIIDEVHMLTTEAFNTLLKTLEEPPERVKFIFATTQPYKVPETILSRCQRLDFRRIPTDLIAEQLANVIKAEKLKVEKAVLATIARTAKGGMRDALSLLDLLIAQGKKKITVDDMNAVLGLVGDENRFLLTTALKDADLKKALSVFHSSLEQGTDIGQFIDELLEHFRALLLVKSCGKDAPGLDELKETLDRLEKCAKDFSAEAIIHAIQILSDTATRIRTSTQARTLVELSLVKLSRLSEVQPISELLARLNEIEQRLQTGKVLVGSNASRGAATVTAPAAANPSSTGPKNAATGKWQQLLDCVSEKKGTLAISLEHAQLIQLGDGQLVIGLPRADAFHKSRLESDDSKALIESCAKEITGESCRMRIDLIDSRTTEPSAQKQESAVPAAAESNSTVTDEARQFEERARAEEARSQAIENYKKAVEEAKKDPGVARALDAFQGTITGLGDE